MDTPNKELEKPADVVPPATDVEKKAETPASSASEEIKPNADVEAKLAEFDKVAKTLEKAEHTIVELKKAAKKAEEAGYVPDVDDDLDAKVNEIVDRKLQGLVPQQDQTLSELQDAKRKVAEMTETLKAKSAIVNEGGGTNQDKAKPDVEVPLSAADEALIARSAAKQGVSVRDYKIKHGYIKK